jgi:SAM-dependent methyltransferase
MGQPPKTGTPVQHIPTQDAYDQWAAVYDTDGNMLQSIDDVELSTLLPSFISSVLSSRPSSSSSVSLLDLGCGTGRNTAKLLQYSWPRDRAIDITGLDFSKGMLEVAGKKLAPLKSEGIGLSLAQADCFPTVANKSASPLPEVQDLSPVDGVISTLVLEHIPVQDYFSTLASLVQTGGYALVTNMHSEMGNISQAGFVNEQGVKVRGDSFAHTVEESAEEAKRAGFEVLKTKERSVEDIDVKEGRVGERGKKWIGIRVWYALELRKVA